jgi:hypothetical protein
MSRLGSLPTPMYRRERLVAAAAGAASLAMLGPLLKPMILN